MPPNVIPKSAALVKQSSYGDKVSSFRFMGIDIIIPYHGQYKLVRNLVESILLHTTSSKYLITLVDDASPNPQFLTDMTNAAPIFGVRQEQRRGFGAAINAGLEKTINPWVVILHSDCLIKQRNWLQELGDSFLKLKDERVRLIHTRTNTPTVDSPYLPSTEAKAMTDDQIINTDDPVPLISCMFPRELLNVIGGPLKEYPYAGYENVELYFRMKKHRYKQGVCGKAWVYHSGSATIKELTSKQRRVIESNYDACIADIKKL